MIEETLGFNGHNPVKSQILKVNLVNYLSTGSPDVIHQRVSPHFYWVFHHKETHLFGWLIKPEALKLLEGEKNEVPNGEFMDHVVRSSNNQFCILYSLCNFPALKSNMDLENRRLEKEIPFGHCDVWVPSYFFGVCLYVYLFHGSSSDAT